METLHKNKMQRFLLGARRYKQQSARKTIKYVCKQLLYYFRPGQIQMPHNILVRIHADIPAYHYIAGNPPKN